MTLTNPAAAVAAKNDRLTRLLGYLDHDPDNQRLLEDVLDSALELGAFAHARRAWDRLVASDGRSPLRRYQEGVLLLGEGQPVAAGEVLGALWREGVRQSAVQEVWVRALVAQRAWPAVLEALAQWDPDSQSVMQAEYLALAQLRACHALGDGPRATQLAALWGESRLLAWPRALGALLSIGLDSQQWAEVQAWLSRLDGQAVAGNPELLCARGWMSLLHGSFPSAQADFEQALRQAPELDRARLGQGLCQALGGHEGVKEAWLASLGSGPQAAAGRWGMAWLALVDGRLGDAAQHLQTLQTMGMDGAELAAAMALLAALGRDEAAFQRWLHKARSFGPEGAMVRLAESVWACREQTHASVAHWLRAAQHRL